MIRHPEHHHVQNNAMQRTRMRAPMQANQQPIVMAVPNSHPGVLMSMMPTGSMKPHQQQQNATPVMYYDTGIIATPLPLPSSANVPSTQPADHTTPEYNVPMADHPNAEQKQATPSSPVLPNTATPTSSNNGSSTNTITASSLLNTTHTILSNTTASTNNLNLKEKTPMCLVNELARFNKIQHQYRLTNEQGPAHKKIFTVTLKLGNEEYEAEGASIKKAQHSAAALALEKTQLKHPPPKSVRPNRLGGADGSGGRTRYGVVNSFYTPPSNLSRRSGSGGLVMPTVELNALAMKRGERTVYIVGPGANGAPWHQHQQVNHQQHHQGWQQSGAGSGCYPRHSTMYQGYRCGVGVNGGNGGGNAGSVGYFDHRMPMIPPRSAGQPTHSRSYGTSGASGGSAASAAAHDNNSNSRYTGFQPAASNNITVAVPFPAPNHGGPYHKQQNMSNGGGLHMAPPPQHLGMLGHHPPHHHHHHHMSPHQYHHHAPPPSGHHMPLDAATGQPQPPPSPSVTVSLHIGDREYMGMGNTVQSAKHDAATKAIADIKEMNNNSSTANNTTDSATTPSNANVDSTVATDAKDSEHNATTATLTTAPSDLINHELKSPISLVYEIALKRHMNVLFEVVSENGPPHMKVFVTRCRIGEVTVVGEGNGKKVSKKRAAEKMLEQLEQCPQLPPPVVGAFAQVKRVRPVAKKKGRNLIKVNAERTGPDSQEDINPISRLIQIQQANKEKEPVYTVMEERGAPRRREFIIQATVNGCSCKGTGPNKKIAKRNAAQALLALLGYSTTNATKSSTPATSSGAVGNVTQSCGTDIVAETPASDKSRKVSFQADEKQKAKDKSMEKEQTQSQTSTQPQTANSGSTILGAGVGGRQLAPGLLLVNEQTAHSKPKTVNDTTDSKPKPSANSMRNNAPSTHPYGPAVNTSVIRAKDKLMRLATLLDIQVQYSDFPKANHDMYLSLVSLNTVPPQVCHGEGATTEASQETAAAEALNALLELGMDLSVMKDRDTSSPGARAAAAAPTNCPNDSVKNRNSGMNNNSTQ